MKFWVLYILSKGSYSIMIEMFQNSMLGWSFGFGIVYFLRENKVRPNLIRTILYELKCLWVLWGSGNMGFLSCAGWGAFCGWMGGLQVEGCGKDCFVNAPNLKGDSVFPESQSCQFRQGWGVFFFLTNLSFLCGMWRFCVGSWESFIHFIYVYVCMHVCM